MTYDELIAKIQRRARLYIKGKLSFDRGVVYDAINDAARELAFKTKDRLTTATLSLIAGTRDYTISSAIATDVDEIHYIQFDAGSIEPRTIYEFQAEIFKDVSDEDDIVSGTPEFYRVWNGVLRVYPTPSEAKTTTVYYSVKIPTSFYSSGNGAATIPLNDEYLNALIYETIAILLEGEGLEGKANYYRTVAQEKLDEASAARPNYSFNTGVVVHDALG